MVQLEARVHLLASCSPDPFQPSRSRKSENGSVLRAVCSQPLGHCSVLLEVKTLEPDL
jgi:hypothetical protein